MAAPFPADWQPALVIPHPDDTEYGAAAAVAKWTSTGRTLRYVFGCRCEAGIAGMTPEEAGPLREEEPQRRSGCTILNLGRPGRQYPQLPETAQQDRGHLRRTETRCCADHRRRS